MTKDRLVEEAHQATTYGVFAHAEKEPKRPDYAPLCGSLRIGVIVLCMGVATLILLQQTSMTAAIVLMPTSNNNNQSQIVFIRHHHNYSNTPSNVSLNKKHSNDDNNIWSLDWDKKMESLIVAMFFVGYYIIQLPSAYAVRKFGPKRIIMFGLMVSSVLQFLTVPACFYHVGWLLTARLLTGVTSGILYGATFDLVARWTPRHETSFLFGVVGAGVELGSPLCFFLSLIISKIDLGGRWPQVFYVQGGFGIFLFVVIGIVASDSPFTNRFISYKEADYIEEYRAPIKSSGKVPVLAILRSKAVWAVMISQLGNDWIANVMMTQLPLYHETVMGLSETQVNILGSAPLVLAFVFLLLSGYIADVHMQRKIMTRTFTRKLYDGSTKVFAIIASIGLCFLPKKSFTGAFIMNSFIAIGLGLTNGAGYLPNQGEIGPAYTAFICAFCQTGAMWVGIVVPIFYGHVTIHNKLPEWQLCFGATSVVLLFTLLFYSIFGSGELQPWALDQDLPNSDSIEFQKKTNKDKK